MIVQSPGLVAPGRLEVIENKIIPVPGEVGPEGIGRWTEIDPIDGRHHIDISHPEVLTLIERLGGVIMDGSEKDGQTYCVLGAFARSAWGMAEQAAENWGFGTTECVSVTVQGYDESRRLDNLRVRQVPSRELIEERDVLLFDEIWDSGRALKWGRQYFIHNLGARSVRTAALIWRNTGTGTDRPDFHAIQANHGYYYDFPKLRRNPRAHLLHRAK